MEPRPDGPLAYALNGQILLRLRTESRLLPTSIINQASRARALEIEEQQGYKPGRKQMKEIKELITLELLPKAFIVGRDTYIWLDTVNHWLVIDAASNTKSDEVMGLLAKTLIPFPVVPLHVATSPAAAMTQWLYEDDAPAGFSIDQDTELQARGESRAAVRYVRQSVDVEDVQKHVQLGKQCTRLAMTQAWMRDVSLFAVATGMRETEILSLTRSRIDMAQCNAWVTADGAKSGYARSVPLNENAMSALRRRLLTAKNLIFTRDTQRNTDGEMQIQHIDHRVLTKACKQVEITDFRFHDFRHTWASWHVQQGTPLLVLKELGGWETIEMVQKYAHLAPSHIASHAKTVTFWPQQKQKKEKAA